MDITLFASSFIKTFGLLAFAWSILVLVAYTFNKATGDEGHAADLAGAAAFAFWAPILGFVVLVFSTTRTLEPSELPNDGTAVQIPFEFLVGGTIGLVAYLCLSYLAKDYFAAKKKGA